MIVSGKCGSTLAVCFTLALGAFGFAPASVGQVAEDLFNEQGYRQKHYRRPTPPEAPAGQYLTTEQLQRALAGSDAPRLIDVQAISLRPEAEEFGLSWLPNDTRLHIAGSTWLPNVGYAELDERMTQFFRSNLERVSDGDKNAGLVFYCVVDCWMSWNAVRRAASWGYANLYWYPDGTDGWADAGLPLVPGSPEPLDDMDEYAEDTQVSVDPDSFFQTSPEIDLAKIAAQARSEDKEILLFFETEHCQFCRRMRSSVFTDQGLKARLHEDFIALAVDMESPELLLTQTGQARRQSEYSQNEHRVVATPTMVFVDADFDLLHRHTGLIATPGEMERLLSFVSERKYEEQSWRSYRRP